MSVVIETTIGDLTVDLFTEDRPAACLNFMKLCKLKYYNYSLFHTVEQGFIAQCGDPSGAGDGGSSIWGVVEGTHKRFFEAESLPKIYHSNAGLLSLVSAGKNLVGSQFFITLGSNLTSLDGMHCVIGEVVEGHETLRKLNDTIVDESFRPYQDVRITHTVILDDPFADPRGFQVPSRSPSPSADRMQNGRIAADEDIEDTDGKTMEEIHEMLAEREAKARATILEIVGDLPDAEMAPPENVLFVCKLNPVTTDDDLEIIFSRFGKVKGCEVIRDKKSGDSLQYAFVEFEERKACEAAYFKMDNVLIDDRRIHVDFSQSVAKVKWRGKGRGVEGPDGRIDFNNLKEESGGRGRQVARRRSGNEDRPRHERGRMTSGERRKAREERHRAQNDRGQRPGYRSRTRSRSRNLKSRQDYESRQCDSHRSDRERRERGNQSPVRRRQREDSRSHKRKEERDASRSSSRNRIRRRSSDRRISHKKRQTPDRRAQPNSISETRRKRDTSVENFKRSGHKEKGGHKKVNKKNKSKKPKSSESETESSSDDSSSSSSSSSESTSDSSSEDERKKRKKSKKSKKSKSHKKAKKHKK